MPVLRTYVLPHPPLAIPGVGRGQEQKISGTLAALDAVAREIAQAAPDTLIFITPHSTVYQDYFHISPGAHARGDLSSFGARDIRFETTYDTELAQMIARKAQAAGIHAGTRGERDARLDHGVMVAMWYINRHCAAYRSVRVSASGLGAQEHYRLGQCICEAAEDTGRRIVLVASGDLSHKLAADGPYGYAPEGALFDRAVTEALAAGDFQALFMMTDVLREKAAECGYSPIMALAGCLDRLSVTPKLLSYEGPFGVGYAVVSLTPGRTDETRAFLDRYRDRLLDTVRKRRAAENAYCGLARRSLEHQVLRHTPLPLPDDLPADMTACRAGVFVSLHLDGRLRGCIGTLAPAADHIGLEIMHNAVSAGLFDSRFEPVTAEELEWIDYKVDILSPPETISGPEALDVKRYGVIVSNGSKRGLLLPDLEGVDTVEEQIRIARRKANIPENAPVKLERFLVMRYA
jgi:AmmeMemoRadiSam system protein A/AmmeMemoRadiSam system protein B